LTDLTVIYLNPVAKQSRLFKPLISRQTRRDDASPMRTASQNHLLGRLNLELLSQASQW